MGRREGFVVDQLGVIVVGGVGGGGSCFLRSSRIQDFRRVGRRRSRLRVKKGSLSALQACGECLPYADSSTT